jgi:hypothetical protein
MLTRRIALAVMIVAAAGALVWLVARRGGPTKSGIDAPAQPDARQAAQPAPGAQLDATLDASKRVAEKERELPVDPQRSTNPPISAESSANGPGLLVRVLAPSREPLPGAVLFCVTRGPETLSVQVPHRTDDSGSERLHAPPGCNFEIRASDPQDRYAPAYAFGVPSEQRTLDLVLEQATPHTLLVVDEEGKPVETFAWRTLDERQYRSPRTGNLPHDEFGQGCDSMLGEGLEGAYHPQPQDHQAHPGGRVDFSSGSLAFVVQVDAEDCAPAQDGPFAAEGARSEIRVVLQHLPGLRGRVMHAGVGVAQASVRLLALGSAHKRTLLDEFPTRFRFPAEVSATCAADGSFVLPLRSSGTFVIQALAPDLCPTESEPREYSAGRGASGIEITLPDAGSIEGRILLASDAPPQKWIIGATQCNSLLQSVHALADGRFHLEGLSPGPWLLRVRENDVADCGVSSVSEVHGEELEPIRYTCTVEAGKATQVEFDLREQAILSCEVRLAGWEEAIGHAWLSPAGATFSRRAVAKVTGSTLFHVAGDQTGEYELVIQLDQLDSGPMLWLTDRLRLSAGESHWLAELPVGELVLVNTLDAQATANLSCQLAGARRASLSVALGPHEERRISGLPLGTWRRTHTDNAGTVEDARVEVGSANSARFDWN